MIAHDQLLFLTVAAFGTPPMRCTFAEDFATTPSMIGLIRDQLIEIAPAVPGSLRVTIKATPRGRVYLDAMCALPLPIATTDWRMP